MAYFLDDFTFPSTMQGMRESGWKITQKEKGILESDDNPIAAHYNADVKSNAMSAVLTWIDNADFTYNTMDEFITGISGIDDVDEEDDNKSDNDDLVGYYNDIWEQAANAMIYLGAKAKDVQTFYEGGDKADDAGALLGNFLSTKMDALKAEDSELINDFAFGTDAVMESADQTHIGILEDMKQKVVRDGQKVTVVKHTHKVHLSSAQKAGLKKAQKKAHTAAANRKRAKSLKIGQKMGLNG